MLRKLFEKYQTIPLPVKATFWFAVCNAIQSGCKFLAMPFLIRVLTTEEYGTYSVFLSWTQLLTVFATLHLHAGVFNNALFKYPDRRDQSTSVMQSLAMVLTAVTFALYLMFTPFWDRLFDMDRWITLMIFVQLFFTESFLLWSARQRFEYKYLHLLGYTALLSVLYALLPAAAALACRPGKRLMAVICSGVIIQSGFGLGFMVYNYVKGRCFFDRRLWGFSLRFNLPLVPHYLSGIILGQADRVMIRRYIGASEAGIYSFVYNISLAINIVTSAINNAIIPYTYKKLKEKEQRDLQAVINSLLLLVGGMVLVLSIAAPEIIRVVATDAYYEAIGLVPVIALSSYFTFVYSLFGNVEFYFEANKFITFASAVGAVLNVILNYLLLPVFGYYVAAYTTLACYIMFALAHYVFMRQVCRKRMSGERVYDGKAILLLSVFFVAAVFGVIPLYEHPLARYGMLAIAGAACFAERHVFIQNFKTMRRNAHEDHRDDADQTAQ